MELFILHLWRNPRFFFSAALIVFFSVSCHEYMHALVALKFGDDTAYSRGHLSLNPLRQMGVWSLALFCIIGIAWGQVPVDPAKLRGRFAAAAVAAAGPLTNLVLGILFLAGCDLCVHFSDTPFASAMLYYGGELNFILFFFNLVPIPGLDGGALLGNFFPGLWAPRGERGRGIFFFAMLALVFFALRYLSMLATFCAVKTLDLMESFFR